MRSQRKTAGSAPNRRTTAATAPMRWLPVKSPASSLVPRVISFRRLWSREVGPFVQKTGATTTWPS
eukprot:4322661-Alexandrium_andersonii.AAC.1